jgi:imidazolonepropionase-like amidohydrolase
MGVESQLYLVTPQLTLVIKIATRNGAQALGIERDVGTIESGKQADMIVLSENPLDDISNTKKIEGVIVDGQFIDSEQISETEIEN